MIVLLIILAYVANVFLNRWLNKVLFKINEDFEPTPFIWFWSLPSTIILIIGVMIELFSLNDWFTGKHWKK